MKCHFCSHEPTHTCLVCGVFFCDLHGTFQDSPKIQKYPMLNSCCQRCQLKVRQNWRVLGKVFGGIGLGLLLVSGVVIAVTSQLLPGMIFLGQGLVFSLLGLVFFLKRESR